MKSAAVLILALGLAAAMPALAHTEKCGLRAEVAEALAEVYGESRQGFGMTFDGHVFEFWVDSKDQSWTAAILYADGRACRLSEGNFWTEEKMERVKWTK